ncbi:P-II family nitrogen regulator [Oscillospiraceae bacterium MB08-C2-2]|nr:P-II family nitrogen regulator [Oscillospiraceae bacterium MB08-C2-2]
MKKLEIIIRPESLEDLKNILNSHTVGGMTVASVMGCGQQKGDVHSEFKGLQVMNINLLPKIMVIAVVQDEKVEDLLTRIQETISSGRVGDGKVFIYDVVDAMRIRTGERGAKVV